MNKNDKLKDCEFKMFEMKGNKEAKILLIEKNFRDLTILEKQIIMDEDFLCVAYEDSLGKYTLGVGHTNGVHKKDKCSIAMALAWLQDDIETARKDCKSIFYNFESHSKIRQHALISMAYNLGAPRLKKFKKTINLINAHKYPQASVEMLRSSWHRQVWERSLTIAETIVKEC